MKDPQLIGKTITTMVIDNRATGEHMRQWRVELGFSLREFASRLGISAPYLSDLELGRRNWSKAKIERWKEAANQK